MARAINHDRAKGAITDASTLATVHTMDDLRRLAVEAMPTRRWLLLDTVRGWALYRPIEVSPGAEYVLLAEPVYALLRRCVRTVRGASVQYHTTRALYDQAVERLFGSKFAAHPWHEGAEVELDGHELVIVDVQKGRGRPAGFTRVLATEDGLPVAGGECECPWQCPVCGTTCDESWGACFHCGEDRDANRGGTLAVELVVEDLFVVCAACRRRRS